MIKKDINKLNIIATYNLVYNASILVNNGLGYALTLDKLINSDDSGLTYYEENGEEENALEMAFYVTEYADEAAEYFGRE